MHARLEAGELFVDVAFARPAFGVDQWRSVPMWSARRSPSALSLRESVRVGVSDPCEFALEFAASIGTEGATHWRARSA